jgi:hypothetical protein
LDGCSSSDSDAASKGATEEEERRVAASDEGSGIEEEKEGERGVAFAPSSSRLIELAAALLPSIGAVS